MKLDQSAPCVYCDREVSTGFELEPGGVAETAAGAMRIRFPRIVPMCLSCRILVDKNHVLLGREKDRIRARIWERHQCRLF